METRFLTIDPAQPDPEVLAEAGRILRAGGLVVMPTETVYGIAADAFNVGAVETLRAAKGRPDTKPLPVMVAGADEIREFARRVPPEAQALAQAFWPGPLTMVIDSGDAIGEAVHSGTKKVGLRAPDHPVAQGILKAAGRPLVLTSANLSGEPDATTGQEALAALDGRVDLVVDAGPTRLGQPSTVIDLTAVPPRILREGRIPADRLREYISLES
jgi:L-threonylcarbamoyladenylate synthase